MYAKSSLKVIEWGNFISAPFAARLLGDTGAGVIKIEPPDGGDNARLHGPFPGDCPDPERSGLFLYLNFNKTGVTLDPTHPQGSEILVKMLRQADVFITNKPQKHLSANSLDYESLKSACPRLIYTSITPYGLTGPYKDWSGCDLTACALGGITSTIGYPDREPLTPPLNQGDHQSGLIASIATLLALFARDATGEGRLVDISVADCWATIHVGMGTQNFLEEGRVRQRSGHMVPHYPYPDAVLPCKDGAICVDTPQNRQWRRFLEVMGNPSWASDPIFQDRIDTADNHSKQADAYLESWLAQHTKAEIFEACQAARVPCAPIRTVAEVVNDEQIKQRRFFATAGNDKYPGICFQSSLEPFKIYLPAPRLGEHNRKVYGELLGHTDAELAELKREEVI